MLSLLPLLLLLPSGIHSWSSALLEARLRFLDSLKAEYFKAKREGKLGSSGK